MNASTFDAQNRCPRCGAPQDVARAEGLCPRCLVAMNLASETAVPADLGPGKEDRPPKASSAPPSPADIARHFPQLEILEYLGRGGMGVVYKARQPQLNRFVALKILAPEREHDPAFSERFTREAQTLAGMNHPNIVVVHDFGKVEGLFYLVMEFVDGVSLRQLLKTKKVSPEEALTIVPRICEALQYAHEQGVVHRDIKPENILLDKQGRVKIADFGIAKIVGASQIQPALTQDQVLGTPHYMAPEQIERPQAVDHRADIYSLGVVFYEMLTGELPLGKFAPPSSLVQVDVRLDEIVLHALEKQPNRRYQHASQVKTDVETMSSSLASSSGAPAGSGPWSRAGIGLTGILVGTRGSERAIHWAGVLREWLCIGILAGFAFFLFGQLTRLHIGLLECWIVMLFPAAVWIAAWVWRAWALPKDKLRSLGPVPGAFVPSDRPEDLVGSCRIPGTNLALVESRNGQRFLNWTNVGWAGVLLVLADFLGVRLIGFVADQAGFSIEGNTLQNVGIALAFAVAFVLGIVVRGALQFPPQTSETQSRPEPLPATRAGQVTAVLWGDIVGNLWALTALVLLVGRTVARTQPVMYSFFGIGGWYYPSSYDLLVGIGFGLALVCLVVPRLIQRGGVPDGSSESAARNYVFSSVWGLAALVLLVGRTVARTQPDMYSFFGVGGWYYPSGYDLLVAVCFAFALAWLALPRLMKRGRGAKWRNDLRVRPANSAEAETSPPTLNDQALAAVKTQVKAPASGVFLAGCLNLAVIAAVLLTSIAVPGVESSQRASTQFFLLPLVAVLFIIAVIIAGGSRMKRLASYRLAVTASILSILLPPGALIGLPFGIWALVVLHRPDVRAAFDEAARIEGARAARKWPSVI